MRFEEDVQACYAQVQAAAKRSVHVAEKSGVAAYPNELKEDMQDIKVEHIVELGTVEIPVDSIVGTVGCNEMGLYSPEFMPAAAADSPFAVQWCQLYMDYLSDAGWYAPIRCVEFLGRFYVQDGKKRVSVLKAHGAYTTEAIVTRLLPEETGEEAIRSYYSFLEDYEKTGLYQAAFTQPGGLNKLQKALGHDQDYVWNDQDRFGFRFHLLTVHYALKRTFRDSMNVTAADALLVLLEKFTYQEINQMKPWQVSRELQNAWEKLYNVAVPVFETAEFEEEKKVS